MRVVSNTSAVLLACLLGAWFIGILQEIGNRWVFFKVR